MKGIILAGGTGSRLYPSTLVVNKQLLPVYNKPMIYYPLSTLIDIGITEVLLITTEQDQSQYRKLLKDGKQLGISIEYITQAKADGIAQAFVLGKDFIGNSQVCLILGDNIFYGDGFISKVKTGIQKVSLVNGAVIFGYEVSDPERYGVIEFEGDRVKSIIEKPKHPKSNHAVVGLYIYDNKCVKLAQDLKPSDRGEFEITDLILKYLALSKLSVIRLNTGIAWLDTGTHESLTQASSFIQAIETRQNKMVGCIEESAFNQSLISIKELKVLGKSIKNDYGKYLIKLVK